MTKCDFCLKNEERGYTSHVTGKETHFCCNQHRIYFCRREERHRRKKEHRCIDCGIKVKPIIKYPARCPEHIKANRWWDKQPILLKPKEN